MWMLIRVLVFCLAISESFSRVLDDDWNIGKPCIFNRDCCEGFTWGGECGCIKGVCTYNAFKGFGTECVDYEDCNELDRCKGDKCWCMKDFCYKAQCKTSADCDNTAHCEGKSCICEEWRHGCRKRECNTDKDCATVKTERRDCASLDPIIYNKCKCLPSGFCMAPENEQLENIEEEIPDPRAGFVSDGKCPDGKIDQCVKTGACTEDKPCKCHYSWCETAAWDVDKININNITDSMIPEWHMCRKMNNCDKYLEYQKKLVVEHNKSSVRNKMMRKFNCRTTKDCQDYILKCQSGKGCKCAEKKMVNGHAWGRCRKIN